MRTEESEDREDAERLLLRELRSPQNARYLRALPPFRLDDEIPDMLESLLDQLRDAESRSPPKAADRRGGAGVDRRATGAVHAPSVR